MVRWRILNIATKAHHKPTNSPLTSPSDSFKGLDMPNHKVIWELSSYCAQIPFQTPAVTQIGFGGNFFYNSAAW